MPSGRTGRILEKGRMRSGKGHVPQERARCSESHSAERRRPRITSQLGDEVAHNAQRPAPMDNGAGLWRERAFHIAGEGVRDAKS